MIPYILILTCVSISYGNPVQPFKFAQQVYYTPSSSQYVSNGLYPFIQYPGISPPFGKALQSIQTPNELIFYPNAQPVIVNQQLGNIPVAPRFTAPPNGLVDAIYAWFAENNIPLPVDSKKNEAIPERDSSAKDPEKIEPTEKTDQAGEAEVLAEAERSYPKKVGSPNFKPGQRFYILNGQPQFFGNYQPIPRLQPVAVPQLLARSPYPADTQNLLYVQSQPGIQQPQKFRNQQIQNNQLLRNQQIQTNQILSRNNIQEQNTQAEEENQQNYVFLQDNNQGNPTQNQAQEYPQQQVLLGRYLPQINANQQQISQTPIHQTHYVPVEVVPPQVPVHSDHIQYQNQELQQPELSQQQLSFIHIPVDRNVQPPQYIKSIVPIQIKARTQVPEIPLTPVQNQPAPQRTNQILYLSAPVDKPEDTKEQLQEQQEDAVPPGVAALEFARYIASRQGELYSDSVVVDAKANDDSKEEENSNEDEPQADNPVELEPSIAQAHPGAVALAGKGGVASSAPRGTALVGDKGLAVSSPRATAVAGAQEDEEKVDEKRKKIV